MEYSWIFTNYHLFDFVLIMFEKTWLNIVNVVRFWYVQHCLQMTLAMKAFWMCFLREEHALSVKHLILLGFSKHPRCGRFGVGCVCTAGGSSSLPGVFLGFICLSSLSLCFRSAFATSSFVGWDNGVRAFGHIWPTTVVLHWDLSLSWVVVFLSSTGPLWGIHPFVSGILNYLLAGLLVVAWLWGWDKDLGFSNICNHVPLYSAWGSTLG